MKRLLFRILLLLYIFFLNVNTVLAFYNCEPPFATVDLDINNIRTVISNGGDLFTNKHDLGWAYYEIPKGSGKHSMYASGINIGGVDASNNAYVSNTMHYQEILYSYFSGPLNDTGGISIQDCIYWNRIFNVYGDEIKKHKRNPSENYNIYKWPGEIAPFFDKNNDGVYDPSLGEYPVLDASQPNLIPGQMVYAVFNDVGENKISSNSNSFLRFEIHSIAYAFQSEKESINNSAFVKYKLINKSSQSYYNFKFSYFHDFDIGNHQDDYTGCDLSTNTRGEKRNLFYTYNSDNLDDANSTLNYYLYSPPAIGMVFLDSKKSTSLLFNNSVESSLTYDGYYAPSLPIVYHELAYWNYMNAKTLRGNKVFRYGSEKGLGDVGDVTKFLFPGDTDPLGRPAWYEKGPNMVTPLSISTIGLNEYKPGEVREIDIAIVWARDTPGTNLSSLEKLRLTSDTVIDAYRNYFNNYILSTSKEKLAHYTFYPNPANNFIYVKSSNRNAEKYIDVKIYTSNGTIVLQRKLFNEERLDLSNLDDGIYIISINKTSHKLFINR